MNQPLSEILVINDLTVRFDLFEKSNIAIKDFDLKLYEGEMLGIVGGASSGKSILLKSIINLVPYPGYIAGGEVIFNGTDLFHTSEENLNKIRGNDISLILSNPRTVLNPLQTVGDQVANVSRSHHDISKAQAKKQALEMFSKVGIPDPARRINAYPHELSGGMCQRIVIGMALINSPKVLLADEISSGLDVTVQRQIFDLLSALIKDYRSSTIIVTRDFGVVANYCNRVIVMSKGMVVEMDDVRNFFDRAQHPISVNLLRSTLAARGRKGNEEPIIRNESDLSGGKLVEFESGHFVRVNK